VRRESDKPVQIGDKKTRYTFRIYDEPTEPDSKECMRRQIGFLQDLVDQPALLQAGYTFCKKFSIEHNGTEWVLYGEVVAEEA
jgi:hypothetical protein